MKPIDLIQVYNDTVDAHRNESNANAQAAEAVNLKFASAEYERVLVETGSMLKAFAAWFAARDA